MNTVGWNKVYTEKEMAKYPDTELVRFVARNYYNIPNRKDVKFLDVGCGAGPSAWYLAREGFSVAAIDGSAVAMERMRKRFEDESLEAFMGCGDIAQLEFRPEFFDCIIDISSLCYISEGKIDDVMRQLYRVLKVGGKFFSITPDKTCAKPPFNHTVDGVDLNARFMDLQEVKDQFKEFSITNISSYVYGSESNRINLWETWAVK